jgi:hypothetical protein
VQDCRNEDVRAGNKGVEITVKRVGVNLRDDGLDLLLCPLLAKEGGEFATFSCERVLC